MPNSVECPNCGYADAVPWRCPECGKIDLDNNTHGRDQR